MTELQTDSTIGSRASPFPRPPAPLCTLEPPEPPPELVAKALRYGWPSGAELIPLFLRLGPDDDGGDLGRLDVQRLTVALTAVTSHDARGPVPASPTTEPTSGRSPSPRESAGASQAASGASPKKPSRPASGSTRPALTWCPVAHRSSSGTCHGPRSAAFALRRAYTDRSRPELPEHPDARSRCLPCCPNVAKAKK